MKKNILLLALLCAMSPAYTAANLRQVKCHVETRSTDDIPEIKMTRSVNPHMAAKSGMTLNESFESADNTFPEDWTLSCTNEID